VNQPVGQSSEPKAQEALSAKVLRLGRLFLPAQIGAAFDQGLFPILISLVTVLVVAPLLILFLAATWLAIASDIDSEALRSLRRLYLSSVHAGLSTEEVVEESYSRLDYMVTFDRTLLAHHAPRFDLGLSLQRGQKAELQIDEIRMDLADLAAESCSLPEDDLKLVKVTIGGRSVATLGEERNLNFEIGSSWWERNADRMPTASELAQRFRVELTPEARSALGRCALVKLSGSIKVFKNVVDVTGA
jgi:hypothetical protein